MNNIVLNLLGWLFLAVVGPIIGYFSMTMTWGLEIKSWGYFIIFYILGIIYMIVVQSAIKKD